MIKDLNKSENPTKIQPNLINKNELATIEEAFSKNKAKKAHVHFLYLQMANRRNFQEKSYNDYNTLLRSKVNSLMSLNKKHDELLARSQSKLTIKTNIKNDVFHYSKIFSKTYDVEDPKKSITAKRIEKLNKLNITKVISAYESIRNALSQPDILTTELSLMPKPLPPENNNNNN